MAGGGSNTQTTTVEIPAWLQEAAQGLMARANQTSQIGYTPYYGPDVAAMTPLQEAAIANTNMGASAFGLGGTPSPMAGMPAVQTFANGMRGYSSGGMYDQALAELAARNPGQYAALRAPFINPQTGAAPTGVYGAPPPSMVAQTARTPMYRDPNEPRQGSASSRNTSFDTYSTAADTKARAMSYGPQPRSGAPSNPNAGRKK
jgi:hypothetical protein